ncbi:MAG: metallophosphoesterase [Eubacteriales bacterium]|nr:metallophosphoesterase [Eubacteriales bacterium]
MKNSIKYILVTLMIVIMSVTLMACTVNEKTEIETYDIDGEVLRVGIISDSQLSPKGEEDIKYNNLKQSLTVLKNNDVDMILFAGDIGDLGKAPVYDLYNKAIDQVFGDQRPIIQTIMGNHDYWENGTPYNCRRLFEKKMGHSPWSHYVVGGYHFIGASPAYGGMDDGYKEVAGWLKKELDKAVADDPDKPIFVTTHNYAVDTAYGSDEWGDLYINDIFKNYPQVVNFGGHSHYSILDERAIHQENYTTITTQSVSYTELETGKENGTIPPNADKTPMGLIMDVSSDEIVIHRYNFSVQYGVSGYEEKDPWILPTTLNKQNFSYTNSIRMANNEAPQMTAASGSSFVKDGKIYLGFSAGKDDDFVHSYKIEWSNGTSQLYFSDFYNGLSAMATTVDLEILNMPQGNYTAKIYAVDSWGRVSDNYTVIIDVAI